MGRFEAFEREKELAAVIEQLDVFASSTPLQQAMLLEGDAGIENHRLGRARPRGAKTIALVALPRRVGIT